MRKAIAISPHPTMCGHCCRYGVVRGPLDGLDPSTSETWVCTWTSREDLLRIKADDLSYDWEARTEACGGDMGVAFAEIAALAGVAWEPLGPEANDRILCAIAENGIGPPSVVVKGGVRVYSHF